MYIYNALLELLAVTVLYIFVNLINLMKYV